MANQHTLAQFALGPAERLLNERIRLSREAAAIADKLNGRTLSVTLTELPLTVFVTMDGGRIKLVPEASGRGDVELHGSALDLLRLVESPQTTPIGDQRIRIVGDAELAGEFRALLTSAAPDPEAFLARLVGEPMAFQIVNTVQLAAAELRSAVSRGSDFVADTLQEDTELLPAHDEIERWVDGVEAARDATDRLAARIGRLKSTINEPPKA